MHVHLVGFGLAGAAVAFHLLRQRESFHLPVTLSVVDEAGAAGGATRAAAGLLHAYSPRARKLWLGDEGLHCAREMFEAVTGAASRPFAQRTGIVKMASSTREQADYAAAAAAAAAATTELAWDAARQQLWIADGWTVDAVAYVEAVRRHLMQHATAFMVEWETRAVTDLSAEMQRAGQLARRPLCHGARLPAPAHCIVVVAAGAGSKALLPSLPLWLCRGQNLVYAAAPGNGLHKRSDSDTSPPAIMARGKYLVPMPDGARIIGGVTKEYAPGDLANAAAAATAANAWLQAPADITVARQALEAPLRELVARWQDAHRTSVPSPRAPPEPIEAVAGVRALPPRRPEGSVPLIGQLAVPDAPASTSVLYITGLGSRGLVYHAVMGKRLVEQIVQLATTEADRHNTGAMPQAASRAP